MRKSLDMTSTSTGVSLRFRVAAPMVETHDYEFSHGRRPGGMGSWAFSFDRRHPHVEEVWWAEDDRGIRWLSYRDAKRRAIAEGRKRNAEIIYVLG